MANRPAPHAHPAARTLIPRAWLLDPLRCPVCQNQMRVITVIDDPRLVQEILRHPGAWQDPPARVFRPPANFAPWLVRLKNRFSLTCAAHVAITALRIDIGSSSLIKVMLVFRLVRPMNVSLFLAASVALQPPLPNQSQLFQRRLCRRFSVRWIQLLLLALPVMVHAQFNCMTNADSTITITGYTGPSGWVTIPAVLNGLPVTKIGDWAFYSLPVSTVTLTHNVTDIGDGAFFDCESLTNVTVSESVTNIGNWAFAFCPRLTMLGFRGNAPNLGGVDTFHGDTGIAYYLPSTLGWEATFGGLTTVVWNPSVPFNYATNDDTVSITGYTGAAADVVIPTSIDFLPVTSISGGAFAGRADLTSITLGDRVTDIGGWAFNGCTSLRSVRLPDGLTSIWDSGFLACSSLTSITIPDSVTSVGDSAFYFCSGLTNVSIGHGLANIGYRVFMECAALSSVTIPANVTSIGSQAFEGCSSLTRVTIPEGVTGIGDQAFWLCTSLTSISIPSSVTSIGSMVFESCNSLTEILVDPRNPVCSSTGGVLFDKSQTTIIQYPAGKAGSYTIPEGVVIIGGEAFYNCANLTSVAVPDSVNIIGEYAFWECLQLTNVTVGRNVGAIAGNAFALCENLSGVYFQDIPRI